MYEKCPTCGFATIYKGHKQEVKTNASNIEKTTQSSSNSRTSPEPALQAQQEFSWDEQRAAPPLRQHQRKEIANTKQKAVKPKGKLCRLRALVRWTGWDRDQITYLVATQRLRVMRLRPGGRLFYYVESAQTILDGSEVSGRPEPASQVQGAGSNRGA